MVAASSLISWSSGSENAFGALVDNGVITVDDFCLPGQADTGDDTFLYRHVVLALGLRFSEYPVPLLINELIGYAVDRVEQALMIQLLIYV